MEEKINTAEILNDKPQGTKLYDLLYNVGVELCAVGDIDTEAEILCTNKTDYDTNCYHGYSEFGTLVGYIDGLQILLPSKDMRDWRKFAWKKGDILVSNDNDTHIIFKGFSKDDYTTFEGKHWICVSKKRHISHLDAQNTQDYHIEDDKAAAQTYINTIEKRLGGKLNLETLEIEKQPEFKDGDIVTMHKENCDIVSIFSRLKTEVSFYYYAFHAIQTNNTGVMDCYTTLPRAWTFFEGKMNFATDSEKQQLFEALAKEGKAWDAEKKQIVDLKPKVELKPFDKVLVKDNPYGSWEPALFWKKVDVKDLHPYMIIGGKRYRFCEPYEGNECLLDNK